MLLFPVVVPVFVTIVLGNKLPGVNVKFAVSYLEN